MVLAICGNKMAPYGTLYWNQFINKYHKYMKAIVQIPLGSSRHVTTRYLVRAFEHKEKLCRDVTRHVAFVGEHNVTRSSRQARLAQHVFRGFFTSLIPEVVLRSKQIQRKNDQTWTHEHYCFFVVRHVGTNTAWHARYDALKPSYVSCGRLTITI